MAIPRKFSMAFDEAFPHGLFVVTEVDQVLDFKKSTKEMKVQQFDEETGLPLWQVTCLDPDPEAKKAAKTVTVKIPAKHQPVPPENKDGSPFTPVELVGLEAMPWVDKVSDEISRISWSFRAQSMHAPGSVKKSPASGSSASGTPSSGGSSGSSSSAA